MSHFPKALLFITLLALCGCETAIQPNPQPETQPSEESETQEPTENIAPRISFIPDLEVAQARPISVTFEVEDEVPGSVSLNFDTSDPTLLSSADITLSNSGQAYTLTLLPDGNGVGSVAIHITAKDEVGLETVNSFRLNVSRPFTGPPIELPLPRTDDSDATVFTGVGTASSDQVFLSGLDEVYVYDVAEGTAKLNQILRPKPSSEEDLNLRGFGNALAVAGDHLVVGASGSSTSAGASSGAAVVFKRSEEGWVETQTLIPQENSSYRSLGSRLAASETITILETARPRAGGSAHVFKRVGDGWTFDRVLHSSEQPPAAEQNYAIVWPNLLTRNGENWTVDRLGSGFGTFAGLAGEHAFFKVDDEQDNPIRVSVNLLSEGGFEQQQILEAQNPQRYENFGSSVMTEGDFIAVSSQSPSRLSLYTYRLYRDVWHQVLNLDLGDSSSPEPDPANLSLSNLRFPEGVKPLAVTDEFILLAKRGSGSAEEFQRGAAYILLE